MFNGKLKAVTFSYDDGVVQDRRLVELFNYYGVKATFNLNSGMFGEKCSRMYGDILIHPDRLERGEIATLYRGHEIASHTITHPQLPNESDEEVIRQVEQDRLNLSNLCGYEVLGLAFPGNSPSSDERVERLVREHTGCRYARAAGFTGGFAFPTDLYHIQPTVYHVLWDDTMRLAGEFVELRPNTPQVFYIMGHGYELDVADGWRHMEEFLQFIAGREDVFYGTNRQVFLGE